MGRQVDPVPEVPGDAETQSADWWRLLPQDCDTDHPRSLQANDSLGTNQSSNTFKTSHGPHPSISQLTRNISCSQQPLTIFAEPSCEENSYSEPHQTDTIQITGSQFYDQRNCEIDGFDIVLSRIVLPTQRGRRCFPRIAAGSHERRALLMKRAKISIFMDQTKQCECQFDMLVLLF